MMKWDPQQYAKHVRQSLIDALVNFDDMAKNKLEARVSEYIDYENNKVHCPHCDGSLFNPPSHGETIGHGEVSFRYYCASCGKFAFSARGERDRAIIQKMRKSDFNRRNSDNEI